MSIYAKETSVPVERSRAEIERTLSRYGASAFGYGTDATKAVIQFQAKDRRIRFVLPLPDRNSREFLYTPSAGRIRSTDESLRAWEQACRQRWRALALSIKAKLETVESGIETFDVAFMAHILLPGGKTVAEMIGPSIDTAYKTGQVPNLLTWEGPKP